MDSVDSYIGKCLKRFAARQHPPAHSRARLLSKAAGLAVQPKLEGLLPIAARRHIERRQHREDWATHLMNWAMIDAFNTGAANGRMIL